MRLSKSAPLHVREKLTKIHIVVAAMILAALSTGIFYTVKPISALGVGYSSQDESCLEGQEEECNKLQIASLALESALIGGQSSLAINTSYLAAKTVDEVTVLFGGVEAEVLEIYADENVGKNRWASLYVMAPKMTHLLETTVVDVTVIDHVSNETHTLTDAFTFNLPVPLEVSDVSFHEQDGEKTLLVTTVGDPANGDAGDMMFNGTYAILNGASLALCASSFGMTAQEVIDMMLEQSGQDLTGHVTDDKPCFGMSPPAGAEPGAHVFIQLPNDFDINDAGTISVIGSPVFTFNQSVDPAEPTNPGDEIGYAGVPRLDSVSWLGGKPILRGVYASTNTARLAVNFAGETYVLGESDELTVEGDSWTLDLTGQEQAYEPGAYEVRLVATDQSGEQLAATSSVTLESGTPEDESAEGEAGEDADGAVGVDNGGRLADTGEAALVILGLAVGLIGSSAIVLRKIA